MTQVVESPIHPLALVPDRHDLPELERQDEDDAALWASEQSHEQYLNFVMEGGLAEQEKSQC